MPSATFQDTAAVTLAARRCGHDNGRTSAPLESTRRSQGSSGSLAAGGTRFQAAAGIEDSPQRHADDIIAVSKDESTRDLVEALCAVAPVYTEWLADDLDYPMEIGVDMPRGGQSVPRLHTDRGRLGGHFFVRRLREAVLAAPNIAFVDRTPGVGLLSDDSGVVGVRVREATGDAAVTANAVVLATDGFAANSALLAEHIPDAVDDYFSGVSTSTGDALTWALDLGATTRHMGSFLGHGLVVPGHGTRLNPALPFRGALLVTPAGERFVDEHKHGYSSLGAIVRTLPDRRAVMLWPASVHDEVLNSELMRESERAGAFRRFEGIDDLCDTLSVDREALARTIRDFVSRDDVTDTEQQLTFPLYAAWVTSGILTTQGGLDVDLLGRVKHRDGGTIPGLFAGGGTAVGISGPDSRGYSSGNGLLSACGLGWIIGNHLAQA